MLPASDKFRDDKAFWVGCYAEIASPDHIAAMHEYFKTVKVDLKTRPVSQVRKDETEAQLPAYVKFIEDLIQHPNDSSVTIHNSRRMVKHTKVKRMFGNMSIKKVPTNDKLAKPDFRYKFGVTYIKSLYAAWVVSEKLSITHNPPKMIIQKLKFSKKSLFK